LDLSRNALHSLARLAFHPHAPLLQHLHSLSLARNRLRSTKGLECLSTLQRLDLSHNLLGDWADVERLEPLSDLGALALEGNPLVAAAASPREYRLRVFALLRPPPRVQAAQWGGSSR
jgi:Leucine-rich repeat (LRR) protein